MLNDIVSYIVGERLWETVAFLSGVGTVLFLRAFRDAFRG